MPSIWVTRLKLALITHPILYLPNLRQLLVFPQFLLRTSAAQKNEIESSPVISHSTFVSRWCFLIAFGRRIEPTNNGKRPEFITSPLKTGRIRLYKAAGGGLEEFYYICGTTVEYNNYIKNMQSSIICFGFLFLLLECSQAAFNCSAPPNFNNFVRIVMNQRVVPEIIGYSFRTLTLAVALRNWIWEMCPKSVTNMWVDWTRRTPNIPALLIWYVDMSFL